MRKNEQQSQKFKKRDRQIILSNVPKPNSVIGLIVTKFEYSTNLDFNNAIIRISSLQVSNIKQTIRIHTQHPYGLSKQPYDVTGITGAAGMASHSLNRNKNHPLSFSLYASVATDK